MKRDDTNDADRICPKCGSNKVAKIIWGLPAWTDEFEAALDRGEVVLGGCFITPNNPMYECRECGTRFGRSPIFDEFIELFEKRQLKGIVYGAAVGDALGVPFESQGRDTFVCKGMTDGGARQMPKGTFSDNTSLLLATCDSIRECGHVDADDMGSRLRGWLYEGAYTPDGSIFHARNTTSAALSEGCGQTNEYSNDNGSLLRVASLACTDATDDEIRVVSAITHAHSISMKTCVLFVHALRAALEDGVEGIAQAIEDHMPDDGRFRFLADVTSWPREFVRSTSYVLHTLGAALWCVGNTGNYDDCVLAAVNLGDNTAATACVAGALAGAVYGYGSINEDWIEQLRRKEIINRSIFGRDEPIRVDRDNPAQSLREYDDKRHRRG